ncbi:hypothetical protein [Virgibacillus ainsalahensis]
MGYILPITPYQYNDYQSRILENKRISHSVERPFKVMLEKRHQDIRNEYNRLSPGTYHNHFEQNTSKSPAAERLFGKLTGKGRNFSERV